MSAFFSKTNMKKKVVFVIVLIIIAMFISLFGTMMLLQMKNISNAVIPNVTVVPRVKIPLDGSWKFKIDPHNIGEEEGWFVRDNFVDSYDIEVPYCYQSQFAHLRQYHGFFWYQKTFNLPRNHSGARVILHIGAFNYDPKIWLNGRLVGEFLGGYYPLDIDITHFVSFDKENTLTIKGFHPDPPLLSQYPHGKQTWYSFVGGIWQSTYVEITSHIYISDVFVIPNIKDSKIKVKVTLGNMPENIDEFKIKLRAVAPDGMVFEKEFDITNPVGGEFEMILPEMHVWSPDNPQLYKLTVSLRRDNDVIDEITITTGMREVEKKDGKIYLNGKPIYLRGVLDQDFYPNTIYTPPDEDFIRKQIEMAKAMGINLIRIHIKIADPKYLELADKLGILIWEEIPNVSSFTLSAEERLAETFRKMILRDRNHPSIIIWGIANEAWGVDPSTPRGREWLIKMYNMAKELDPTRLVVDNSPCCNNFHVISDIADFHWYNTIPGSYEQWRDFVRRFATNPRFVFGNNPIIKGDEPLIVSEFGVWGLPSLEKIYSDYNGVPWWFETGWGAGIPKDVESRFSDWRLDDVWKNYEELAVATQIHQFNALKFMIEEMRKYPQIVGYIITEFYDLHWESNGLLDFYRNPKVYFNNLKLINADDVLVIDWSKSKLNLWSGEEFSADIYVSHFSSRDLKDLTLEWELVGFLRNEVKGLAIEPYTVKKIAEIKFKAPFTPLPTEAELRAVLKSKDGEVLLSNTITILLVPEELKFLAIDRDVRLVIYTKGIPTAAYHYLLNKVEELRTHGYNILLTEKIEPNIHCVVSLIYDDAISEFVERGGNLLLLAPYETSLRIGDKNLNIVRRGGEWVTEFQYIRAKFIISPLTMKNPLGWSYYMVYPDYVVKGLSKEEAENVWSGYFEGWIREHAATTVFLSVDSGGKVIITTFNPSHYLEDPVTTIIINNLLKTLLECW